MAKINIFYFFLLSCLILQILSLEQAIYKDTKIKDMKSSFWNSINDGFYHLNPDVIPKGHTVIAFSDLSGDGYTDIITYTNITENEKKIYTFYNHTYDKEQYNFLKEKLLFNISGNDIDSIRNLFIGKLYGDEICYLASFNKKDSEELLHYIKCGSGKEQLMDITSNILILNRDVEGKAQILYNKDGEKKICLLKRIDNRYVCNFKDIITDKNKGKNISTEGGVAYIDVDGNCAPDILVSYDEGNERYIEIYLFDRKGENYVFAQQLHVGPKDQYGAFTISRIKNEKNGENAPQFDILVPNIQNNTIKAFKNIIKKKYKWGTFFCDEDDIKNINGETTIFDDGTEYELPTINNEKRTLDNSFVTVIRPGDFLSSSNPGILVKQDITEDNSVISLYSKEKDNFELYLQIDKKQLNANPRMALFFDINESGSLGLIVQDVNLTNHFFFNYRKNTYFIKSKLMNDENLLTDTNLGVYYRYIVTDKSGDRHMDISYQLAQNSDMNAPLPYSLVGLGETNNYVENFQIISGNYYGNKDKFKDKKHRNFKDYTPIIPNTQMKIFKFLKKGEYEWSINLIVQPTDSLVVIVIVLIAVMLVNLGVIIYLHIREVKEEQKEMNKFKSWFA